MKHHTWHFFFQTAEIVLTYPASRSLSHKLRNNNSKQSTQSECTIHRPSVCSCGLHATFIWKDQASLSQRSVRQTLEDVSTWTRPLHHERARLPRSSIRWHRLLSDVAVWSRVLPSTASHSVPLAHTCRGSRAQLSAHSPLSRPS